MIAIDYVTILEFCCLDVVIVICSRLPHSTFPVTTQAYIYCTWPLLHFLLFVVSVPALYTLFILPIPTLCYIVVIALPLSYLYFTFVLLLLLLCIIVVITFYSFPFILLLFGAILLLFYYYLHYDVTL